MARADFGGERTLSCQFRRSALAGWELRGRNVLVFPIAYCDPMATVKLNRWAVVMMRLSSCDLETDELAFLWDRSPQRLSYGSVVRRVPGDDDALLSKGWPCSRPALVVADTSHVIVLLAQSSHDIAIDPASLDAPE